MRRNVVVVVMAVSVVLVLGAGFFLFWPSEYSTEGKACNDFEVEPLQRLFGTGPAVMVEETPGSQEISCGYRIVAEGGEEAGVALVALGARTFATPEQARAQLDRHQLDGEGNEEVSGIGERALMFAIPMSSDAPQVMTNYTLSVWHEKLFLAVSLQALNVEGVDTAAVRPALIDVARRAMSTLD
ncbi:MAG TPA: hypothetical protein VF062_07405 [Candidatus Limnocylindrales bacterium]